MVSEIATAFKEQLKENKWIGTEFRKAMFRKLDDMMSTLLYDDISTNDTALDRLYSEHLKIKRRPFLNMLDEVAYTEKEVLFYKLLYYFDVKKASTTIAAKANDPVNAFYILSANTMIVPLGYVQYPRFDITYPRAYNFGSIGSIIAHEIAHGFDVDGIRYDHTGNLTNWFEKKWLYIFKEKAKCYVDLYNSKTIPVFDMPLNGKRTLVENLADNEGVKIAYKAFKKHQEKHGVDARTDLFEDFTNDQLFFLSFAMGFCTKTSDMTLHRDLKYRKHSSSVYRVNIVLQNTPQFSSSFFCPPESNMNPVDRCSVW